MSRMRPEYLDPDLPDHPVAADVLLRQEPDGDEEEDGGHGNGNDDDDDNESDEGYSE